MTHVAGKFGAQSAVFLVSGFNMLANKVQTASFKIEAMLEPSHGLGDSWEESLPTGMSKATIVQDGGFWDTTAGFIHAQLAAEAGAQTPQSVPKIVVLAFGGNTIGSPMVGFQGAFNGEYEVIAEVNKLQRANAAWTIAGAADRGVILHALTNETTDAVTEPANSVDHTTEAWNRVVPITSSNATGEVITCTVPHGLTAGDTVLISGHTGSTPSINSIQNVVTVPSPTTFTVTTDITVGGTGGTLVQAGSSNGGVGYLEATLVTLGTWTSMTVSLRHSVDNSVFVDLGVFTTRTTIGAERITTVGTVRRYLACSVDFVGAGTGGSFTYLAGFARNQ